MRAQAFSDDSIHSSQPFDKPTDWSFVACPNRQQCALANLKPAEWTVLKRVNLTRISAIHSTRVGFVSHDGLALAEQVGNNLEHTFLGLNNLDDAISFWFSTKDTTKQVSKTTKGTSWQDLVRLFPQEGKENPHNDVHKKDHTHRELSKVILEHVQYSEQESCIDRNGLFHMLQMCTEQKDLAGGKRALLSCVESGLESEALIGSQLIQVFEACENLVEAQRIFHKIWAPDALAWSAIITAYSNFGQEKQAIDLYFAMLDQDAWPDSYVFVAVLKTCSLITHGKLVHAHVMETGFESNSFVGNALITMYIKCGELNDAIVLFSRLPGHDVVTWSALISGYVQYGFAEEAIELFENMQFVGISPNPFTFSCILKACAITRALELGLQLNSDIIEAGLEFEIVVANTLITMYCECKRFDLACGVLSRLPYRDAATWSAIFTGYAQAGLGQEVVSLLHKMTVDDGVQPDKITFISSLKACPSHGALRQGEQIHSYAVAYGLEFEIEVGNALIDMYGRCGTLDWALIVLQRMPKRDIVTWSGLISGYASHGLGQDALQTFYCMEMDGLIASWVTFLSLLKACAGTVDFGQDNQVHALIIEGGFYDNVFVSSGLIDLYGKHDNLQDSQLVFNRVHERDVGTWNAMLCVYVQQGLALPAIKLFRQMQEEGLRPDGITMVGVLKACSSVGALEQGVQAHSYVNETGLEADIFVANTLIDMYGKCGAVDDARIVFDSLHKRDVVTWNALIAAFSQNCDYKQAALCLENMRQGGWNPDEVTFLCVLSACAHNGLVKEGSTHFKSMVEDHCILPLQEHLNAMVELFGHAERFSEAEDLLETIPFQCNFAGWTSLLCSCEMHCNVRVGNRCFEHLVRLDPKFAPAYVRMQNLYIKAGMWEDARRIQSLKWHTNTWKKPARAFIEINREVHQFIVGDKNHPSSDSIYAKLRELDSQLKEEGYERQPRLLAANSDDTCGHSEKLALAFGLLSTPQGTTLRILKNLRVCGDCHEANRIISKVERRDIVIIDAYCVHKFREGECSCATKV